VDGRKKQSGRETHLAVVVRLPLPGHVAAGREGGADGPEDVAAAQERRGADPDLAHARQDPAAAGLACEARSRVQRREGVADVAGRPGARLAALSAAATLACRRWRCRRRIDAEKLVKVDGRHPSRAVAEAGEAVVDRPLLRRAIGAPRHDRGDTERHKRLERRGGRRRRAIVVQHKLLNPGDVPVPLDPRLHTRGRR